MTLSHTVDKLNTPVLSVPHAGWSHFTLGPFNGACSYLTDVPCDVLDAILYYHRHPITSISFDEEGSEFHVTITPYRTFIVSEREDVETTVIDIDANLLLEKMLADIENNLEDWIRFNCMSNEREEYLQERDSILERLAEIYKIKQEKEKQS